MAAKSYRARVIVLKKTKLRERDLIVTMVDDRGMLRQAVAKGARKPGGSFAARLELFSIVDGWFVEGKSLDIVTDVKFAPEYPVNTFGLEQSACAAAVAELVSSVAQESLAHERLFEMTAKALDLIARSEPECAIALCVADLIKTMSMVGYRPSFDLCVACGTPYDWGAMSDQVRLSIADGGVVCDSCRTVADAVVYDANTVAWARAMVAGTFEDIVGDHPDVSTSFALLQLCKTWARVHIGKSLKSIDYLLSCGLF